MNREDIAADIKNDEDGLQRIIAYHKQLLMKISKMEDQIRHLKSQLEGLNTAVRIGEKSLKDRDATAADRGTMPCT